MNGPHETQAQVLKVSCRSRPLRVAFLVDPTTTTAEQLDKIFAWATCHWGGRYHALFPIVSGEIPEAWWKALTLLDPDAIVTFGSPTPVCLDRIERTILPARILGLNEDDRKHYVEDDHLSMHDLDSIGINAIPRHVWAARGPLEDPVFVLFTRRYPIHRNNRAILRNFGVLDDDIGTKAAFRDLPTTSFDDSSAALTDVLPKLIETGSRAVLPLDLCAYGAAFPATLQYEPRTTGFHLTIGDSAYEAIYHWNRGLLREQGYGHRSLWLPASALSDEALIDAAREWIARFFWTSSGARAGVVISYSLGANELADVAKRLSSGHDTHFTTRTLSPHEFPFPDGHPVRPPDSTPALGLPGRASLNAHVQTLQVPFAGHQALIEPLIPPYLGQFGTGRTWMVDLQLQFHPERHWYTNVRPDWTLPKRSGLAELFVPQKRVRIVAGGLPAAEISQPDAKVILTVPDDRSVFSTLLLGNAYAPPQPGLPPRTTHFRDMWTSDEGALLRGMLRLFGTLFHCALTLGDPFWGPVLHLLAKGEPSQRQACSRKWLEQQFGRMRKEARNTEDINSHYWQKARSFDECAGRDFESLVHTGVLKQGTEIRCSNCGSTFWYSAEHFRSRMPCGGCGEDLSLPPEAPWYYRLNDMVTNAIASSGTCAVLQALSMLEREAHGMFLPLPCQNLAVVGGGQAFTDVDILAIVGSRFVIGEAKSTSTAFQQSEIDKAIHVAEELRPDEFVFGAPGTDWPADVKVSIQGAQTRLESFGVKVRRMELFW